jgi:molybdopterin-guanine dinucleotide biosynthesis protein A
MGQNKALLVLDGRALIEIAAAAVVEAAGNVTLVGPPEVLGGFGYPVIPDIHGHLGPLGGIEAALTHTVDDWNLIVACDMPRLNSAMLRRILDEAAKAPQAGCVLPMGESGKPEPLCAAYHKRCREAVSEALQKGVRKVTAAFPTHLIHYMRVTDDLTFQNINTPEEWRQAVQQR